MQQLWDDCPLVSRSLIVAYPAISATMMLLGGVLKVLLPVCNVLNVLKGGLIWAMPLSFCWRPIQVGPGVLFLFLELYMALTMLSIRERAMGSTVFMCWLAICSTIISAGFVVLMFLLSFAMGPTYLVQPVQGLWPMIMACLTMRSLGKPDEHTQVAGGILNIPNKWYPVFLIALLSLFSGAIMWDMLVALAFGFAHERFKIERLVVGRLWVDSLERRATCLSGRCGQLLGGDWVPTGGAPLPQDELEGGGDRPAQAKAKGPVAFSGAGQRLGSD